MVTEEDFQKKLDEDNTDWQTRLVFADWLEERGDKRATGYRKMGEMKLVITKEDPYYYNETTQQYESMWEVIYRMLEPLCRGIPSLWYILVAKYNQAPNWNALYRSYFNTRKEAEDRIALAYWESINDSNAVT